MANMLMQPTPRNTPAAHAETGLVPAPDAVDVLPIDLKLQALPNYCEAPKAVNITSPPY
jgi:hypothetical protein